VSGTALPRWRIPPPDGSRDRRTEDPTNVWFVHLVGRLLLPAALRLRISANSLSLAGLAFGTSAAFAYTRWPDWRMASLGFALSVCWLIADGMDGMVARATGSTSATGRILDGICDHAVFLFLYVFLAWSIDAYMLAAVASVAHAFQATLYEGERTRFHRRIRGDGGSGKPPRSRNPLVQLYDAVAGSLDRMAEPLDTFIRHSDDPRRIGDLYGRRAAPILRMMALLSNNMRVILIFLACLAGDPRWFWWIEMVPLTIVAALGITLHRRVEADLVRELAA
jgi:CDP-diacylglycerol---serine O-phosphatidyltransferase